MRRTNGTPHEPRRGHPVVCRCVVRAGVRDHPDADMSGVPTRKQFDYLLPLASGNAGLSRTRREIEPLLRHGWVTGELCDRYYQFVRITADGLVALGRAVAEYGLPEIPREQKSVLRRVCAECGSAHYRYENVAPDEAISNPPRRFPTRTAS